MPGPPAALPDRSAAALTERSGAPDDEADARRNVVLAEHRGAQYLCCFVAALVPINMGRYFRVLPSSPDAISCHFRTDGLAAESPRLSYSAFFVFWFALQLLIFLILKNTLRFLALAGMQAGTPSDDRGHQLSMLAVVLFAPPTMCTYMLINLAVIEANAEDTLFSRRATAAQRCASPIPASYARSWSRCTSAASRGSGSSRRSCSG